MSPIKCTLAALTLVFAAGCATGLEPTKTTREPNVPIAPLGPIVEANSLGNTDREPRTHDAPHHQSFDRDRIRVRTECWHCR